MSQMAGYDYSWDVTLGVGGVINNDLTESQTVSPTDNGEILPHHPRLQPNNNEFSYVVEVMHKPRGGGAIWQPIVAYERVRVSAKSGKHMQLVVQANLPFSLDTFNIALLEKAGDSWTVSPHDSFQLHSKRQTSKGGIHMAILELKLFRLYKHVCFEITFNTADRSQVIQLRSVEFITHNTGATANTKNKQIEKKKNMVDHQHSPIQNAAGALVLESGVPYEEKLQHNSPDSYSMAAQPILQESTPSPPHVYPNGQLNYDMTPPPMPPQTPHVSPQSPPMTQASVNGSHFIQHEHSEQPRPPETYFVDGNLTVHGSVVAQHFFQLSDIRYKVNIEDIVDAMDVVQQLSGKRYEWQKGVQMEPQEGARKVIGLIAQEVQKVIPDVVHESPDGYLSVDYAQLMPILIEAFKEYVKEFNDFKEYYNKFNGETTSLVRDLRDLLKKHNEMRDTRSSNSSTAQTSGSTDASEDQQLDTDLSSTKNIHIECIRSPFDTNSDMYAVQFDVDKLSQEKKRKVQLTVSVTQRWKWIIAAIAAGGVFLFACILGLSLGLSSQTPPMIDPPVDITFVPADLQNGDFEKYNSAGVAEGWSGIYDVVILPYSTRGLVHINQSTYPGLLPAPFPTGRAMIRLGGSEFGEGFAKQVVSINTSAISLDNFRALRVTAWSFGKFANDKTPLFPAIYKLAVVPKLNGAILGWRVHKFKFGDGWALGEVEIDLQKESKFNEFEVGLHARCNGSVFFDSVKAIFIPR